MGSIGKSSIALDKVSYQETREWFNEHSNYEEWLEDIADNEYDETIYKYTGDYYSEINHYLRTGEFRPVSKWDEQDTADRMIRELDYAISSFNLKSPIQVYRASDTSMFGNPNMSYEQLRSLIGKKVVDKGYLSASTLKSLPGEQTVGGNVSYEITVSGGKGNGAFISKYSENPQEREVLLRRNGAYIVDDVKRDNNGHVTIRMRLTK